MPILSVSASSKTRKTKYVHCRIVTKKSKGIMLTFMLSAGRYPGNEAAIA